MNAVVVSICIMIVLALVRVNVVIALTISAIIGGLIAGMSLDQTLKAFESGLGGGATIAVSYAMLGAFAVAISKTGVIELLVKRSINFLDYEQSKVTATTLKYITLAILVLITMSSQNLIPVHIAFIPILIPPLLALFEKLKLDRRMIACILTFGLITPYMLLPIGFGGVFLNNILLKYLNENGLENVVISQVPYAMALPCLGMIIGLLIAIFFTYKKPREYKELKVAIENNEQDIDKKSLYVVVFAIFITLGIQLYSGSMIFGGLAGFMVFFLGGVIKYKEKNDIFTKGVHMMALIGFIMITAAGFAEVMKQTGGVETLVESLSLTFGDNKSLAALFMLIVGLLVTMGIGSSFSTIPIIAIIYVPLALEFGFSSMATIALVGTAAALGDAGSPASDSTLGPTSGLNADGQHDHIWDSVVPTFIHYNIPLIIFGWIAAMVL